MATNPPPDASVNPASASPSVCSPRDLPAVHDVLTAMASLAPDCAAPRPLIPQAARQVLASLRDRLRQGPVPASDLATAAVARATLAELDRLDSDRLRPVINATGIILHTNLGRAPLAESAIAAIDQIARGGVNLELDLASGQRSSRQDAIRAALCQLTGPEAATAVNNNAAATMLALRAVAAGREVVVARGQLIEIGGSFRIPEIMAASGAMLREVGTTNITRLSDYAAAISERTAALLRVHHSNYQIVGHASEPTLADLVKLGHDRGLLVIDDAGSGALCDFAPWGLAGEPLVTASVAAGADLGLFSGDKLLGGPQAGLIVGRADLIRRIEADPLMRALRLDKLVLAALQATLRLWLDPTEAERQIPLLRLVAAAPAQLRARAVALYNALADQPGLTVEVQTDHAYVGGGALPNQELPTWVLALKAAGLPDADLAQRLRLGAPAVVPRVQNGAVLLDLRSVLPEQDEGLLQAVRRAVGGA
ncbi:MAG TPA: L-seryl-tRNA(Sec) selenium transferase [Gemmatales bacterium]|nr:L-seryl-tRNA(Sec) selenium transferase [Gemmatales bacterium]